MVTFISISAVPFSTENLTLWPIVVAKNKYATPVDDDKWIYIIELGLYLWEITLSQAILTEQQHSNSSGDKGRTFRMHNYMHADEPWT